MQGKSSSSNWWPLVSAFREEKLSKSNCIFTNRWLCRHRGCDQRRRRWDGPGGLGGELALIGLNHLDAVEGDVAWIPRLVDGLNFELVNESKISSKH